MERFGSTWFVSSVALAFAALILGRHMSIGGSDDSILAQVVTLAVVGLVFTAVHELIGTFLKLISLPFIVLTLGILLVVINALLLLFTEWIINLFGVDFYVDGFWWAFFAAIIISIGQSIVGAIVRR